MSIRVVAHITARPDTIEETKALLISLITPTRAEAGCISYLLHQNNSNSKEFTFIEEWASDEALDKHFDTPHLAGALAKAGQLLSGPPDIRRYTLIA